MSKITNDYTIANIQFLRALAALLVVLHHAYPHYQVMGGNLKFIMFISQWGFAGVDIFFVISGFIMAYTTFSKPRGFESVKIFLRHRLSRIYLGYWPFFFVMFFSLYLFKTTKIDQLDILGSFFLINSDMFKLVLPVSWSLTYELYFYFLFVFTFFMSPKMLYRFIPVFFLFLLFIVIYDYKLHGAEITFFYSPFLLEFFAGVLLYMYRRFLLNYGVLFISFIVMIIAYKYGIEYETKDGLLRVLSFGVGAVSLVLCMIIIEAKKLYQAKGFIVLLGDASYTIYLSHLILLQMFYFVGLRDLFTCKECILVPELGLVVFLVICIGFSIVYYQKIEKPLYKKAISL